MLINPFQVYKLELIMRNLAYRQWVTTVDSEFN